MSICKSAVGFPSKGPTHITREELLELNFDDIIADEPPYTSERAEVYIQKAATQGPQAFEWRDKTKSGEIIPVEVYLRQTTLDGHQRILAVVRDSTNRKERERELKRKNERLEEFAGVVSHHLRNPVIAAQGRLEFARDESTATISLPSPEPTTGWKR